MRRARIQVRPNIGARKSNVESEKSGDSKEVVKINDETPTTNLNINSDPSGISDSVNIKTEKAVLSEGIYQKEDNQETHDVIDKQTVQTPQPKSKFKHAENNTIDITNESVESDQTCIKKNEAGINKANGAPTIARRNKFKPTVTVKPRVAPDERSKPKEVETTKFDDLDTGEAICKDNNKDKYIVAQSKQSDTPIDNCGITATQFTLIKPHIITTKPSTTPLDTSVRVITDPSLALKTSLKDTTTISIIKKEDVRSKIDPALSLNANIKDRTIVSIVKKDCTIQKADAIASDDLMKAPSHPTHNSTTGDIITKVVPARRSRLLKPRPNLLDSPHNRKRTVSASASDTDDDHAKRALTFNSHLGWPGHETSQRHETSSQRSRCYDRSLDSRVRPKKEEADKNHDESIDENGEKKSMFKLKAEKEYERRCATERRQARRAVALETPVDRSTVRMCDMIFTNPVGSRMKSTILAEERKKKQAEENATKGKNKEGEDHVSVVGTPDRMSVRSRRNSASSVVATPVSAGSNPVHSPPAATPGCDLVGDILASSTTLCAAKQTEPVEEEPLLVPQVKIGPDGQIIINEASLTVAQQQQTPAEDEGDVVVEFGNSTYNPAFYYNSSKRSKTWSWRETKRFYLALSVVGTDFALMTNLFKNRSRLDLKKKFKKEEKTNRWLVDKALKDTKSYDISLFDALSDSEDEKEQLRIKKEEKAAEKKRQRLEKQAEKREAKRQEALKKGCKRRGKRVSMYFAASASESEDEANDKEKNNTAAEPTQSQVLGEPPVATEAHSTEATEATNKDKKRTRKSKGDREGAGTKKRKKKEGEVEEADTNEAPTQAVEVGEEKKKKYKKECLKSPVPEALTNLRGWRLLLLSAEDGGNPAGGASQNGGAGGRGEVIHMYVVDEEGEEGQEGGDQKGPAVVHTTGVVTSPASTPRPHRVHRDSINEALQAAADSPAGNPFAAFMANKLLSTSSPLRVLASPPLPQQARPLHTTLLLPTGSLPHSAGKGRSQGAENFHLPPSANRLKDKYQARQFVDLTLFGTSANVREIDPSVDAYVQNYLGGASSGAVVNKKGPYCTSRVRKNSKSVNETPTVDQDHTTAAASVGSLALSENKPLNTGKSPTLSLSGSLHTEDLAARKGMVPDDTGEPFSYLRSLQSASPIPTGLSPAQQANPGLPGSFLHGPSMFLQPPTPSRMACLDRISTTRDSPVRQGEKSSSSSSPLQMTAIKLPTTSLDSNTSHYLHSDGNLIRHSSPSLPLGIKPLVTERHDKESPLGGEKTCKEHDNSSLRLQAPRQTLPSTTDITHGAKHETASPVKLLSPTPDLHRPPLSSSVVASTASLCLVPQSLMSCLDGSTITTSASLCFVSMPSVTTESVPSISRITPVLTTSTSDTPVVKAEKSVPKEFSHLSPRSNLVNRLNRSVPISFDLGGKSNSSVSTYVVSSVTESDKKLASSPMTSPTSRSHILPAPSTSESVPSKTQDSARRLPATQSTRLPSATFSKSSSAVPPKTRLPSATFSSSATESHKPTEAGTAKRVRVPHRPKPNVKSAAATRRKAPASAGSETVDELKTVPGVGPPPPEQWLATNSGTAETPGDSPCEEGAEDQPVVQTIKIRIRQGVERAAAEPCATDSGEIHLFVG